MDAYALSDAVTGIFDILEQFDIAAAHRRIRQQVERPLRDPPMFRRCSPELNCDVVLWRRTESTLQFLESWRDRYLEHTFVHPHDQGAFRWLAWNTDLRVEVAFLQNSTTEAPKFGTTLQSSRTVRRLTSTRVGTHG